jgi:hypothetical protein
MWGWNSGPFERRNRVYVTKAQTALSAVVTKLIPSSPKRTVVGGSYFGAAARFVSYDLRVFDEGRMTFSGGEIEAVEDGKEASIFVSLGGTKGRAPIGRITRGLGGDCRAVGRSEHLLETGLLLFDRDWSSEGRLVM